MAEALTLRPARDDDYLWIARFLPQLNTGDPLPDEQQYRSQYVHRFSLFGAPDAPPIGCAILDVLADTGYVRVVVIDEHARGNGAGGALMRAVAAKLRAAGCRHWCLNVKVDNVPALRLYDRCGLRKAYESHALRLPWERVTSLPETHEIIAARAIEPGDDRAIERAWELPSGQLEGWRAMTGQHLLGLFDPSDPSRTRLGFARANPLHPGVFPFRVARPEYARTLIEAGRALFDTSKPLGVVVEDDLPLAELLIAHGAERKMHLAHLRGAL